MAHETAGIRSVTAGENEAIRHLKEAVALGKPWHIAVLESVGLWTWPEEHCNGQDYCYLIDGEAFDWLLLAERLCREIAAQVPEGELNDLLFFGRLPEEVPEERFRELIGDAKYHAHLNYVYGITVEEFVTLAVDEEIRKERNAHVFSNLGGEFEDSHQRVYGATREELLRRFRLERGHRQTHEIALKELREFTYWLFKYRVNNSDRARVASYTKKGLDCLKRESAAKGREVVEASRSDVIEHRG